MFSSLTSWSCKKRRKFQFTVTPVNGNRKKKYALQSSFTCILTFSPLKKISDFFFGEGASVHSLNLEERCVTTLKTAV